jgi:hypothetical protein
MLVVVELGCQEYIGARDAGCLDALPDLLLVIWPNVTSVQLKNRYRRT